jgi:hypothetical protein
MYEAVAAVACEHPCTQLLTSYRSMHSVYALIHILCNHAAMQPLCATLRLQAATLRAHPHSSYTASYTALSDKHATLVHVLHSYH